MALVEGAAPSEGEIQASLGLLEAGGGSRYKAFVDPEGKARSEIGVMKRKFLGCGREGEQTCASFWRRRRAASLSYCGIRQDEAQGAG